MTFNFGVQYEIKHNYLLEVTYQGSAGFGQHAATSRWLARLRRGPFQFEQHRPPVVSLNHFVYPGGCSLPVPAGFDRTQCNYRIGNAGRNIMSSFPLIWSQVSAQKNFQIGERFRTQLRCDFQNALKTYNFNNPGTSVNFLNPHTFAKVTGDPATASLGGQPLMNLTLMVSF